MDQATNDMILAGIATLKEMCDAAKGNFDDSGLATLVDLIAHNALTVLEQNSKNNKIRRKCVGLMSLWAQATESTKVPPEILDCFVDLLKAGKCVSPICRN